MRNVLLSAFSASLLACATCLAADNPPGGVDARKVADAIRAEATRPNDDPAGRPLPLAGHWNTGSYTRAAGMDAAFQISLIERGEYVLPSFQLNAPHWDTVPDKYYEAPMKRAAELKLPFGFISTQWESILTDDKGYFGLPAEGNPNVVTPDGKIDKRVSPFGPADLWREAGQRWSGLAALRKCQEWYPDPPLVVFVSNNEHAKLTWSDAEKSKRYLDKYGRGKPDEFKRGVFADAWIERYRALQSGIRDGLTAAAWKKNAIFVGYEAFGPCHFGRWGGWMEYSLIVKGRADPWPLAWDGGSPSYYASNWCPISDHTVWSPQVESMNWPFMLDEAWKLNPKFWWEISVWDGHEPDRADDKRKTYEKEGHPFTPERYRGFVQFGMWLLRPRVVREFRGWTDSRDKMLPYFNEILASVRRVHESATLTSFWRLGRLVPNRAAQHPYQEKIPDEYQKTDRWFLLDTDLTPKRPWTLTTDIPVFALALVDGKEPERRWLIYAHAPVKAREKVRIDLPAVGPVTCDVPVGGVFLLLDERTKSLTPVDK